MKNAVFSVIFWFIAVGCTMAQNLNATVSVNSSQIQGNRQLFNTLEEQLRIFINDGKWTDTHPPAHGKIDCSFILVVNEMSSPSSFKGELQVQARRPVPGASYKTPLLNYREPSFLFDYMEYQSLEFNPDNIPNNLVATIAFYVYLILGLDYDSTSPLGGTDCFRQMQIIASNVQSNNWSGWEAFGSERSKYAIAVAFNEPVFEDYRRMWYDYHRAGLDEMAANREKGRQKVVTSLPVISSIYVHRSNSVLIMLFGNAKLDELVNVVTGMPEQEKRAAYETLRNIYPTQTTVLERLQRTNR